MKKLIVIKIAIIISLCFAFSGCTVVALEVYSGVFKRFDGDEPITALNSLPREKVWFYSGKNRLEGFIYGKDKTNGLVVISSGIYSYADEYDKIITHLIDEGGWRIFSYNNTGVSGSQGDTQRGLSQAVLDLAAALNYIKTTPYIKDGINDLPVMLVGFSMGGYAVCAVLNYEHDVKAVVSFAGFNSTQEVMESQAVAEVGGIYYVLSPQFWAVEKQLFGDVAHLTAVDGINKSGIPVMIVHCSDDDVIPANTISIYAHRKSITNDKVKIVYLEGEDAKGHYFKKYEAGFNYKNNSENLFDNVNAFLITYK
jgi:dienelactone hydrolase